MTRFWALGIQACTVTARKHFEKAFIDYLNSVYDQALDRDTDNIHTIDSYLKMRRENIGAKPSFVVAALDIDIPDEAFYHPAVVELRSIVAEIIILDNVSFACRRINHSDP